MSFGLSGDDSRNVMIGGDVAVAWIDKETLKGYVDDYYLAAKSQCSGPTGSCPDNRLEDNTNNMRLLNAATVNGYSIVTYQRPLSASDKYDHEIYTNRSQAIIWAVGPLNQRNEVSFHSNYLKTDSFIDFGRPAKWNCPMPESDQPPMRNVQSPLQTRSKIVPEEDISIPPAPSEPPVTESRPRQNERRRGGNRGRPTKQKVATNSQEDDSERSASIKIREQAKTREGNRGSQRIQNNAVKSKVPPPTLVHKRDAWKIPSIQCYEPEDGIFYAQMGPTGGKKGYPAITGHVGWGISWYINGLLIPEINVVRGKTYTFVVEGGTDPEVSAKYHPFYVTDDPVGGYEYKTAQEKEQIKIFAGAAAAKDGSVFPTGTGRLCHWTPTGDKDADDFDSFGAYQRTLELKCDQGEPGVIQWTPDKDTPDTVYYQCFTHRYLGWKINVLDSCDESPAASEIKAVVVPAPGLEEFADKPDIEHEESPSIQVETRVKPNDIFENKEDLITPPLIVSEHSTNPYQVDPTTTQGLPERLLVTRQTPIYVYSPKGQYFPQNQYTFDNLYNFHYNQKKQFKPSLLLNAESKIRTETKPTYLSIITKPTESTTTVKMTTVETTTTTTENPKQKIISVGTAYSNNTETFILPPPNFLPVKFNKIPYRPLSNSKRQAQLVYPMKLQMRRPPPLPLRLNQQMVLKKPIFRPHRPYKQKKLLPHPKVPNVHSEVHSQSFPLHKNPIIFKTIVTNSPDINDVEISPQQSSTEKEPELQTSSMVSIAPTIIRPVIPPLPIAQNTGFKPETVVVESGFKPMAHNNKIKRADMIAPEIQAESEVGVIEIKGEEKIQIRPIQNFEPMFVPSPTEKSKQKRLKIYSHNNKKPYKIIIKARSLIDSPIEPIASAAERVDSYYLPPRDNTQKPIDVIRQPSNIDFEPTSDIELAGSPPDVVVTYDGKKVSGASLTAKPFERSNIFDPRASKASQFLQAKPQSVPFRGELPPLDPAYFNKNAPQLQPTQLGVLSRNLDTPVFPPQGSTRLQRVRREAHHTPEHTAHQEQARKNSTQRNSVSATWPNASLVFLVVFILKYL